MRADPRTLVLAGAGVSLGSVCLAVLVAWLENPALLPAGAIQTTVFGLVFLRVVAFAVVPPIRRMSLSNLTILFGCDILVLPFAGVLYLLTGSPWIGSFSRVFFSSWLSSALLAYPALGSFLVVRAMSQGSKLSYVLPAAAGSFGIVSLSLEGMLSGSISGGIAQVAGVAVEGARGVALTVGWVGPFLYAAGGLLFACLLVYAAVVARSPGGQSVPRLTVGVTGVVALIAWSVLAGPVSALVALDAPAVVIVGVEWIATREG